MQIQSFLSTGLVATLFTLSAVRCMPTYTSSNDNSLIARAPASSSKTSTASRGGSRSGGGSSSGEIFQRFEKVSSPANLYRSSAPHYSGEDTSQKMDSAAISFLVSKKISNIISLNSVVLDSATIKALKGQGISYTQYKVADFQPPTLDQLVAIGKNYGTMAKAKKNTLVYCGYGHGRTGTAVSAIQIQAGVSANYDGNHVETDGQKDVLNKLKAKCKGGCTIL